MRYEKGTMRCCRYQSETERGEGCNRYVKASGQAQAEAQARAWAMSNDSDDVKARFVERPRDAKKERERGGV